MSFRDFKIFVVGEVLLTTLADWTKLSAFRGIRRSVLDRPRATIALRKRDIGAYAAFCGTAPYILAALLIWSMAGTNLLPPDPLQRSYAEIREWENELSEMRGESRAMCETTASFDTSAGRRCFALMPRMIEGFQGEVTDMYREIQVFEAVRSASTNSIFAIIVMFANALVFARIWLRSHPIHARREPKDVGKIWRAYLLVMSTTMFIPNCIGASVFLIIDVATRFVPWMAGGLSGSVFFAGVLPFAVCGVLGCFRLKEVLAPSSNWRIGNIWWIFFISNLVTLILSIILISPLLLFIYMRLFT